MTHGKGDSMNGADLFARSLRAQGVEWIGTLCGHGLNEVYAAWLEGTVLPARAAYGVKELPAGAKVEVVARAVRSSGSA